MNNKQETNDPTIIAQSIDDYFISYPKDLQNQKRGSSFGFSNVVRNNPNIIYVFNSTSVSKLSSMFAKLARSDLLHADTTHTDMTRRK